MRNMSVNCLVLRPLTRPGTTPFDTALCGCRTPRTKSVGVRPGTTPFNTAWCGCRTYRPTEPSRIGRDVRCAYCDFYGQEISRRQLVSFFSTIFILDKSPLCKSVNHQSRFTFGDLSKMEIVEETPQKGD